MLTLIRLAKSRQSSAAAAALIAEYLAFDRRRREARPYIRAFVGFAVLTLVGGILNRVPRSESIEAAGLMLLPVCGLLLVNAWRWSRLQGRLNALRADFQEAGL